MEFEGAIVGMAGRRNGPPLSTRYDDDDDDDDDYLLQRRRNDFNIAGVNIS